MKTFMPTISFPSRNIAKVMAATALLIGVAGFASSARADDIHWSIGLGSPGVTIGMTNARPLPIFVQPQPYYGKPLPVYMQPGLIYSQQVPIYVQPAPIYRSGWAQQGRGYGMGQRHDRHPPHRGQGRGSQGRGH
ncbi:MAG: hypothetical protein Q7U28_15525 [Aquabacterium sp.]|nr:hypothetical protein [Aquabacterium sp.]